MGAAQSTVDPRHVRIWNNLSSLDSASTRMQMLDTLLAGSEYVAVAKRVGIYAALLGWKAATQRGEFYPWPQPSATPHPFVAPPVRPQQQQQLAVLPPGRRDLDALHEAYGVLSIDESQPLTLDALKAYYKRAALKAHPDKGGSPQAFDRAKRAYAYLEEILLKLNPKPQTQPPLHSAQQQQQIVPLPTPPKLPFDDVRLTAPVTMDAALRARDMLQQRTQVQIAPSSNESAVALNPKKLDMATFNKVFEETRMQDPDADGYGDWLKSNTTTQSQDNQALRNKFNAGNFNKAFEDGARGGEPKTESFAPQELTLAPSMGVELGRDRPAQYTVPSGEGSIGYTDLKYAYGEGSTFSQHVADVAVSNKTFDAMKREREAAPVTLSPQEYAAVEAARHAREAAEVARQQRAAAYDADAAQYEARIKGRIQLK